MKPTLVIIKASFDDGIYPWPFRVYSDDPATTAAAHLKAICRLAVEEREEFGEEPA